MRHCHLLIQNTSASEQGWLKYEQLTEQGREGQDLARTLKVVQQHNPLYFYGSPFWELKAQTT